MTDTGGAKKLNRPAAKQEICTFLDAINLITDDYEDYMTDSAEDLRLIKEQIRKKGSIAIGEI